MKREIEVGNATKMVVLAICFAAGLFWFAASANPEMFHAAIGVSALVIVTAPFLVLKRYDLFSPWSIVMLAVISGCTNPAIATSFNWPDKEFVDRSSLLGQDPHYFLYPGFILLCGLALLAVGYFYIPFKSPKLTTGRMLEPTRLYLIIICVVGVSLVSTLGFVSFTGGGSSQQISGKRTTIRTLDVQADKEFSQYGYLRTLATVSLPAFLVLFGFWAHSGQRWTLFKIGCLLAIFLTYCILPFYASNRAPMIWAFIAAMGMMYYSHQRNLAPKFAMLAVLVLGIVILMSSLRNPDAELTAELETLGKQLIFNRNGPELAKTSHVINNVPDKLEYQYGKTIAVWLIAPIPREMLPDKPLIHFGPIIGRRIYGNDLSGVPPGLIAEMYLNFHIPGVIVGCLFFGWFLRKTYELVFSISGEIGIVIPMYLFALLPMAYKVLASSLGSGILCFVNLAMIVGMIYLCTAPKQRYAANSIGQRGALPRA